MDINYYKSNPVSIIFTDNFPKEYRFKSNELFKVFEVKDDNSAFEQLKNNIEDNKFYNTILSGHKTVEEAYGLLKSFLDYNINEGCYFENSYYPFFIFIENEKLNKKTLYSYYLEKEKERTDLPEEFGIDPKIILFANVSCSIKEKLNVVLNYYHRKTIEINKDNNHYYTSLLIKIMYIGVTGSGKSTLINEMNGEKLSYSSYENYLKTRDIYGGNKLLFKNRKYPILNRDTEGYEIGDNTRIEKIYNNILKNMGDNFKERFHIVIILFKNERGLDYDEIALMAKLQEMKILYYAIYSREDDKDLFLRRKSKRVINDLITKLNGNDNDCDSNTKNLFKEFKDKNNLIKILKQILGKIDTIIFSSNILSRKSKGKINLLNKIKDDLNEIYKIHETYIHTIDQDVKFKEKAIISIGGNIILYNNKKNDYSKILDNSPFFFNFSIDDKRKEAEKLLDDCDVSSAWLFFYNQRVESFRKQILEKIQKIYSEVNIDIELNISNFDKNESMFYKTENTKQFIIKLIDFFDEKYKELYKKKYCSLCNESIKQFEKYVEEFSNFKLNGESILYDIDLI